MIKIHFYNVPEDNGEYAMAENAHHAWAAIDESLRLIRAHDKYDVPVETMLDDLRTVLNEAKARIE